MKPSNFLISFGTRRIQVCWRIALNLAVVHAPVARSFLWKEDLRITDTLKARAGLFGRKDEVSITIITSTNVLKLTHPARSAKKILPADENTFSWNMDHDLLATIEFALCMYLKCAWHWVTGERNVVWGIFCQLYVPDRTEYAEQLFRTPILFKVQWGHHHHPL